jgi:hypothetical protein
MYEQDAFAATNAFGGIDYAPHNRGVTPTFFVESVIDPAASELAGRAIYRDMERVRINVAGDSLSVAVHPVDEAQIARFEESYARWKGKQRAKIAGTPLAKWPLATPSFVKEMEFLNILSVDDLATVADVHLDRIADGRAWRDRAAAWLKSAKDGAEAARYAAENHRLRDSLAGLEKRLADLEGGKAAGPPPRARSAKSRASANLRRRLARAEKKAEPSP